MDKKYHEKNPNKKCFGGKVIITMNDGSTILMRLEVADAHINGRNPFGRKEYINKENFEQYNYLKKKVKDF